MMPPVHRLIPPPVALLIAAAAMWASDRLLDSGRVNFDLQALLAFALLVAGLASMSAAVAAMAAAKTTINPLLPSRASRLVTGGVFRLSRNPIYIGDVLVLAALCVWLGQPANAVWLALFVGFIDRFQIRPEEEALRTLFGAQYVAYCARVRRWL
ncbi:MAG: isoprenylcysteine carboxylmethyltransferase family protein [Burkholderiales bacterium]|nr:isoprenylcysteine carboxylmethyltransferase family protein [Burkholderiales bacterium]